VPTLNDHFKSEPEPPDLRPSSNVDFPVAWITGPATDPSPFSWTFSRHYYRHFKTFLIDLIFLRKISVNQVLLEGLRMLFRMDSQCCDQILALNDWQSSHKCLLCINQICDFKSQFEIISILNFLFIALNM
jgi:hypothetical protein